MTLDQGPALIGVLAFLLMACAAPMRRGQGKRRLLRLALLWAGIIASVWAAATIGLRFGATNFT